MFDMSKLVNKFDGDTLSRDYISCEEISPLEGVCAAVMLWCNNIFQGYSNYIQTK